MYFDRFDIVEAYYAFFSNYHSGQDSVFYRRLSKMSEYYTPGVSTRYETMSENSQVIYDNLVDTLWDSLYV